ncbi:NAD-dependent succinate-semialdehyde dehydrogenase [Marinoscillum sp. MHG1-6]|uniref:NAD-dependent succinate-semialdehyde dehydrogenase n=1 Tax=Marinoscillum sp. MHG1-6 TaxID=2959627 RepID=UPI0021576729|nr:NAD-dependent succinate-semialdehyde dehydrogenase [Marinoscillum sp. MHG1-6]
MNTFQTINPATEEIIQSYQYYTKDEVAQIIDSAHSSWLQWRRIGIEERSSYMHRMADLLESKKDELGLLITSEMGKPVGQAVQEVEKCAWVCRYYANEAAKFLTSIPVQTEAQNSFISFQPMGVVFAVMPWNFPFWQVFRFAAPALMAGNGGILKHSPNTTGCGLIIEKLFKEAGFPENLFSTILLDIPDIESVVSNPKIVACTLTGSTEAGRSLAGISAKHLKKSVLELGGSDPYVILEDADLEDAAKKCLTGRMINSGQSCIAAKRFIVTKKNVSHFTKLLKSEISSYISGNPLNPKTKNGPMARKDLADKLELQLQQSLKLGAVLEYQEKVSTERGYYFPTTLLTGVTKGMPAFDEELFGPIAVIIEAETEEEALQIANDTDYGLGAAIFSQDIDRATKLAETELEAGCCFINDNVKSDPRLPFGGIKQSGYGRELSSFGIHEFVNIKSIYQN